MWAPSRPRNRRHGPSRRAARRARRPAVRLGHHHEQVARPAPAELVAGQRLGPRAPGRPRRPPRFLHAVQDDEVPEPLVVLHVGDGGQGHLGQGLVRPLDALGREAEPLGGLEQAQEVRADPVGAGQVAHLLQPDRPAVVHRDRGQRRRPAVGRSFCRTQTYLRNMASAPSSGSGLGGPPMVVPRPARWGPVLADTPMIRGRSRSGRTGAAGGRVGRSVGVSGSATRRCRVRRDSAASVTTCGQRRQAALPSCCHQRQSGRRWHAGNPSTTGGSNWTIRVARRQSSRRNVCIHGPRTVPRSGRPRSARPGARGPGPRP